MIRPPSTFDAKICNGFLVFSRKFHAARLKNTVKAGQTMLFAHFQHQKVEKLVGKELQWLNPSKSARLHIDATKNTQPHMTMHTRIGAVNLLWY